MNALTGIKVVDFSWVTVGPTVARYFSDHGATVVRVESTQYVDITRLTPPYKDNIPGPDRAGLFNTYNLNKYGMTLNLKEAKGVELAKRLVAWADVLLVSFRPGTMKRMGLDYESVKELNPRLIYASTSMMGETGPHRLYGGFGLHAAAVAGFDELTGWPDRAPCGVFSSYTDIVVPPFIMCAILVALLQRQKTGKGQYIDQSQLEASLQFLALPLLDYSVNRRVKARAGNRDDYAAPHGAYRCAGEDRWCVIAVYTDEEWKALCRVMGRQAWIRDHRFATLRVRKENEAELDRLIEEWTNKLQAETVMTLLQQAGVAAGLVETAQDMHKDPQLIYRNHFWVSDHPVINRHTVDALPFRLSKTPATYRLPAPCLGEHNAYVCTEILGMSDEEFVRFVNAGAFG